MLQNFDVILKSFDLFICDEEQRLNLRDATFYFINIDFDAFALLLSLCEANENVFIFFRELSFSVKNVSLTATLSDDLVSWSILDTLVLQLNGETRLKD